MSNSKKSIKETIKKSGKYLREVSVVVIGVAITLSVSFWIGIKNEKRDMALHLRAIKMELRENIGDISIIVQSLNLQCKYTAYLLTHEKELLEKDTLNSYAEICYAPPEKITFKTNAFEMFKNSGTMRLMNDKELLMEIWMAYDYLAILKELIDEHSNLKWNFIEKEISLFDVENEKVECKSIPMYDFYKKTSASYRLLKMSEVALENIHELFLKLVIMQLKTTNIKTYKVTDEELDKYVGVYSNDQFPVKLTITKESKQLFAQLTGQPSYPFFATAKNKFEFERVILEFNPTDKTLTAKQNGEVFTLAKEE
jgi:hypothetical protein